MTWWSKASEAQKLAQIDGGISLGMSHAQIAMASRTSAGAIAGFASRHNRVFSVKSGTASQRRMGSIYRDRAAYARGDRINLWGNTEAQDEFALDEVQS